jgi:hypothetical protein
MFFLDVQWPLLIVIRFLDWVNINKWVPLDNPMLLGKLHHKSKRCKDILPGLAATSKVAYELLDFETCYGVNTVITKFR